jgi:ABC-type glycerol-3-phosphate transport system permease component
MKRLGTALFGERLLKLLALALLAAGSVVFVIPFLTALNLSLKSESEIKTTSTWSIAQMPTLQNYSELLTSPNVSFAGFFWNTLTISVLATLGVLLSSSLVAYGFARLRFRGRDRLFILMLSTMMLPTIITIIPSYLIFARLHWVNTFLPLIVPAWFGGGAFNVFLLRQFFLTVPRELDEAALIDGASHVTIWWRIIMPLSKTALATVGVFAFIYNWRDFLGPLIYLNDTSKQTLELGLATYNSIQQEKYHLLMAGSVLVMLPLVAIFLIGQRYFVKGIVMSGIK